MSTLVDKIRRARESVVAVGAFRFTVRRPTDAEAVGLRAMTFQEIVTDFVVGWDGVREIDLIPGGNPEPVAFDREVWAEWSADRPELWEPIVQEVLESYKRHRGDVEDAVKN